MTFHPNYEINQDYGKCEAIPKVRKRKREIITN